MTGRQRPRGEADLPNFLLVGAHKAATTSIAATLCSHPEVYIPQMKEPHFFVHEEVAGRIPHWVADEVSYRDLFAPAGPARWRGEASVLYLYLHEAAIPRIHRLLGTDTHVLVNLRNPIERAYSAYLDVRRGNVLETLSFEDAIAAEPDRIGSGFGTPTMHYRRLGLYAEQVEHYLDAFPNVHITLYDDFVADRQKYFAGLGEFLDLADGGKGFTTAVHANQGGATWRFPGARRLAVNPGVTRARRAVRRIAPKGYAAVRGTAQSRLMQPADPMSDTTWEDLATYFCSDVTRVGSLLGRDVSHWLKRP